jgi:integrase/recombinase XerD
MEKMYSTLPELIEAVKSEMTRLRYNKKSSIMPYQRIWRQMLAYAENTGERYYTQALGEKFLREKYGINAAESIMPNDLPMWQIRKLRRAVNLLSDYQNGNGIIIRRKWRTAEFTPEYEQLIKMYEEYCIKRNNKRTTISIKLFSLRQFFVYLQNIGLKDPKDLKLTHVYEYMKTIIPYSKRVVADKLCIIRDIMKILSLNGYTEKDLSGMIPRVYNIRYNTLPTVWRKNDIDKLLSVIDRGNPLGKRDYAIMLMVSRLGIRSCDISGLRFDNINWRESKLELIQEKTEKPLILPFDEEIGSAIIDYLKYGRPNDGSNYVFIRHLAPFGPCTQFNTMMQKYISLAGIHIEPSRSHGLHSLRHAFANRLLEENVPVNTIADLLGHSTEKSTGAYLRVGIESLRKCALDPEEVSGYVR